MFQISILKTKTEKLVNKFQLKSRVKSSINFILVSRKYLKVEYSWIYLLLLIASISIYLLSLPNIANKIIEGVSVPNQKVWVLHYSNVQENTSYKVTGDIYKNIVSQSYINFKADDCIESLKINGRDVVELSKLSSEDKCNWQRGVDLKISSYLNQGKNSFEMIIHNNGGGIYFEYNSSIHDWANIIYLLLIGIFASLLIISLQPIFLKSNRSKLVNVLLAILIVFFFLRLPYYELSSWWNRNHDTHGHIDYILYVQNAWSLPASKTCWECHQQPLYYFVSATTIGLTDYFLSIDAYANLKLLSLLSQFYYLIYLIFFAKIILLIVDEIHSRVGNSQNLVDSELKVSLTASSMFLFLNAMPLTYLISNRLNNDTLSYTFIIATYYFLLKIYFTKDNLLFRYTKYAALFIVLAILTKITAIYLFGILILALLAKAYEHAYSLVSDNKYLEIAKQTYNSFWYILKNSMLALGAILITIFAIVSLNIYINGRLDFLGGNVPDFAQMGLQNNVENFFGFDYNKYISEPAILTFEKDSGIKYFFQSLLKSTVIGEHIPFIGMHQEFAKTLGIIYLILIIVSIYFIYQVKAFRRYLIPFITIIIFNILVILTFRVQYPYTPNQDFRYIYPSILGFSSIFLIAHVEALLKIRLPLKESLFYNRTLLLSFIFITLSVIIGIIFMGSFYLQGIY